ncbi:ribose ABC transporter ATP-binding protein [Alcanivorax sp. S71-1-4]|jgi:simple sugar transport system ATP-binding protein|uniref:sugar ABC transporter ATP-binding protein n=1 Tax=Alcanivorax sp. S71-1-4 TaxID=1177159 RepID=UPI00135C184F|nr:sugar ABC transporter ATP-binding protein [Alcanivorax sp. S71-1-4]KAF0811075.1 ribose ABC transporter ATP-binding protein [Alcanivorax sp. S71-1-4]
MKPLIELRNITKEYRGVPAIKDVSLSIYPGETLSLLGENGAGKSTLTKMMAGAVVPSAGSLLIDGKPMRFETPNEALRHGFAMVFQETSLVPSLTVAQNLYLGREPFFNRLRGLYISAQQFLQTLNFNVEPTKLVSQLGAAERQMVEIARALQHKARLIIFDEPTATLTPEEKHHFFGLVERLKKQGVAIVFISHALEEALAISDRITVLRDGEHVLTAPAAELTQDAVIKAMVGRDLSGELYSGIGAHRTPRPAGRKVLSIQNLSMGSMVKNTAFSLYEGQVTGMFGLVGSGRTETAKVIAGVVKRDFLHGGEVFLDGKPVRYRTPRPAVGDGIMYVTEDRKLEGFFETLSISENIFAGKLASAEPVPKVITYREVATVAEHWRKSLNVRAISGDARVIELSGGNQQKVVIAKSLVQKPRVIIFDEPTRGVDVGAIAEIHQLINQLADDGLVVWVISSNLPEILSLSDRILVTRQGRVVEEFRPDQATEEKIMYAAVH